MSSIINKIFSREDHTCPWWLCFTFDNPARGIFQNPYRILNGYIKPGDSILDIGPGMGYFTFPMSRITGPEGKVTALDIQEGMLKRLEKKIAKSGIKNIGIKLYDGNRFTLEEKFNFILMFWMYHEVSNKHVFVKETVSVLEPGGKILIAEPKIHVAKKKFISSLQIFADAGFSVIDEPPVSLSRAVLLQKDQ